MLNDNRPLFLALAVGCEVSDGDFLLSCGMVRASWGNWAHFSDSTQP